MWLLREAKYRILGATKLLTSKFWKYDILLCFYIDLSIKHKNENTDTIMRSVSLLPDLQGFCFWNIFYEEHCERWCSTSIGFQHLLPQLSSPCQLYWGYLSIREIVQLWHAMVAMLNCPRKYVQNIVGLLISIVIKIADQWVYCICIWHGQLHSRSELERMMLKQEPTSWSFSHQVVVECQKKTKFFWTMGKCCKHIRKEASLSHKQQIFLINLYFIAFYSEKDVQYIKWGIKNDNLWIMFIFGSLQCNMTAIKYFIPSPMIYYSNRIFLIKKLNLKYL